MWRVNHYRLWPWCELLLTLAMFRSPLLIPWCHIAAWYFVVDLFNMYDAFQAKHDISHLSWSQRYWTYVGAKWPYVVHHVVLFIFGYQVVVVSDAMASKVSCLSVLDCCSE